MSVPAAGWRQRVGCGPLALPRHRSAPTLRLGRPPSWVRRPPTTWTPPPCVRKPRLLASRAAPLAVGGREAEAEPANDGQVAWEQVLCLEAADRRNTAAIEAAHQQMLARALDAPYSAAAAASRARILDRARDSLLRGDATLGSSILMHGPDAAGYLALLAETGQHALAIQLGDAAAGERGRMDADCEVAMAMAHCALARDLEAGEEVSGAYLSLEAACALLQSSGSADAAGPLMEAVEESMQALRPFFILDQLKMDACEDAAEIPRSRLVALVGQALSADGPAAVSSSYARAALGALTAAETVALAAAWAPGELRARVWWYAGLPEQLGAAHAVMGFVERSPRLIERAMLFCGEDVQDTAARVCRAVCLILLGRTAEAFAALGEANILPWDRASYMGTSGATSDNGGGVDLEDKKSYLYMFTKRWLRDVAVPRFRASTRGQPASFSLIGYFTSFPVQLHLLMSDKRTPLPLLAAAQRFFAAQVTPLVAGVLRFLGRREHEADPWAGGASPLLSRYARQQMRRGGGAGQGRMMQQRVRWLVGLVAAAAACAALAAASGIGFRRHFTIDGASSGQPRTAVVAPMLQRLRPGGHLGEPHIRFRGAPPAAGEQQAVDVMRAWEDVKNAALGNAHDTGRLGEVLCGAELRKWRSIARKTMTSELSWRYEARRVELRPMGRPDASGAASTMQLRAAIHERTTLCDASGPLPEYSFQAAYQMEYTLKQVKGSWKIAKSRLVS